MGISSVLVLAVVGALDELERFARVPMPSRLVSTRMEELDFELGVGMDGGDTRLGVLVDDANAVAEVQFVRIAHRTSSQAGGDYDESATSFFGRAGAPGRSAAA
jgi:hypothetical protein